MFPCFLISLGCFCILCKAVMAPCLEGVALCGRWALLLHLALIFGCFLNSLCTCWGLWGPETQSSCQPEPGTTTCLPGYLLSSHLSRFQFLVWSAWCLTRDLRKPLPLQNSQEPYISLGTQCHKPENSGLSRKPASRCQLFNCKALRWFFWAFKFANSGVYMHDTVWGKRSHKRWVSKDLAGTSLVVSWLRPPSFNYSGLEFNPWLGN